MTVGSNRAIKWSNGLFKNSGQLTFTGPGTEAYFDPKFEQTGGKLEVQGGELKMRSTTIDLQAGTITIADGALLWINSPFGGTQIRRFNGIGEVSGGGELRIYEPMTVSAPLLSRLGTAFGCDGVDGFVPRNDLTLEADLVNAAGSKMRFSGATLLGAGGSFENQGNAVVEPTGSTDFEVDVTNAGLFCLKGASMTLGQGAVFTNNATHTIQISEGNISQGAGAQGRITNHGILSMWGANPSADSNVSVTFENRPNASVGVIHGILRLQGPVLNLQAGVLSGGRWIVSQDGRLEFPGAITELFGAEVIISGTGQIPDLATLERLSGTAVFSVRSGANVVLNDDFSVDEGSSLQVENDASLTDPAGIELTGDGPDGIMSELCGIYVLSKSEGVRSSDGRSPPTITTPILDNVSGRVLPTERGSIGAMQLVGDYIQGLEGYLHIDVDAADADVLLIDGHAALDGALELNRLESVTPGTEYTILTTTGVVSGEFAETIADDRYSVSYQTNSVTVTFEENLSDIFADGFEFGNTSQWSNGAP